MTARPLVALVAAAALATACGDAEVAATTTAACDEPVHPPMQGGSHLIGDASPPVPYSSNPPASGWHASGALPPPGVYETSIPDPQLVSLVEQGRVVVTHRDPLTPPELATATDLIAEVDGLVTTRHELDPADPPFALVAWGVVQRCDELVGDDVATFARAYGGTDREP